MENTMNLSMGEYNLILEIIKGFASMVESNILTEKGCGLDAQLRGTFNQKQKEGLHSAIEYIFDLEEKMQKEGVELPKDLRDKLAILHNRTK